MNNAVVIGWGTVGKATADAFKIDKYYSRTESNIEFDDIAKQKFIFICLPTPTINGICYTDGITDFIRKVIQYPESKNATFIIRSTVNAGYNKHLQQEFGISNIVSNPEFLSEDTAIKDANKPDIIVIGADYPWYREQVYGIYSARFRYVKPIMTDSVTAELLKLTLNAFFTTKVVFANEIFDYAQEVEANYETIKVALEQHPWGSKGHFQIHHKNGRGAGGKCLAKDIESLADATGSLLLSSVYAINQELLRESGKS
jgi:UDPglucose 6-dehydrogenase